MNINIFHDQLKLYACVALPITFYYLLPMNAQSTYKISKNASKRTKTNYFVEEKDFWSLDFCAITKCMIYYVVILFVVFFSKLDGSIKIYLKPCFCCVWISNIFMGISYILSYCGCSSNNTAKSLVKIHYQDP